MCNAIAEGGRRCAVHRHDSLAAVNLATKTSGLTEKQVSDVFTELRREGRSEGRGAADVREWTTYLRQLKSDVERKDASASNLTNIQKAFDGEINAPDKATFYALKNLQERVSQRNSSQSQALTEIARKTKRDPKKVEAKFKAELKKVDTSRKAEVPAEYTASAVTAAQERNLPSDRASVVALARTAEVDRAEGRRVTLEDVESEHFAKAGYDVTSRRMEVSLKAAPTMVAAYKNVSPEQWREFSENYSAESFNTISGNEDHQYANAEEAEADSKAPKCDDCGQFMAEAHSCPPKAVAKKSTKGARKKVTVEAEAEPEPEPEPALDPTDHPDRAVEGVRHVQLADVEIPEYQVTEDLQAHPKAMTGHGTEQLTVTVADLVEGDVRDFRMVRKQQMMSLMRSAENIPEETKQKIKDAPADTIFAVNNAPWIGAWQTEGGGATLHSTTTGYYHNYNAIREATDVDIAFTYNKKHSAMSFNRADETFTLTSRPVGRREEIPQQTREESGAHAQRVRDRGVEGEEAGTVARLEANASFTSRFIVDGNATEQPKVRFPKTSDLKRELTAGKTVQAEMHMKVPGAHAWNQNEIDDQGYAPPVGTHNYEGVVSGRIGLKYDTESKTVSVDPKLTHLQCNCYDYRQKYYCTHINYARRHAPNVARQNLPITPRHNILTAALSRKPNVRVVEEEGREPYISLVHPDTRSDNAWSDVQVQSLVPVTVPDGVNARTMDRTQMRQVMESHRGILNVQIAERVKPRGLLVDSLKRADTQVPVSFTYFNERSNDSMHTPVVSGSATFAKTRDMNNLTVVSHDLKCTCPEYAENYDCKHVRGITPHLSMVASTDDVEGTSLQHVGIDTHSVRSTEVMIQREIFENPDADENAIRERIESERRAEEERIRRYEEQRARERAEYLERVRIRREQEEAERIRRAELAAELARRAEAQYDGYRNRLVERYNETEAGYTNDPEKFFADTSRLAKVKDFDYRYENVLDGAGSGDGARKFGVELEFVMPAGMDPVEKENKMNSIAREMYQEGLSESAYQSRYHAGARSGWAKWSFERDSTVDGEIVSPLLGDDRESWEQLEKVCKIVKKHGGTVNHQAGSHVHVSTGSYGHSTAKHAELNRTVTQHEDLMYRLAANPAKKTHRGVRWCSPNVVDREDDIPENLRRGTVGFRTEHSNMLNMGASSNDQIQKSHVEFRMWDGTLDPGVIQRQVMLSVAMTDQAEQSVIKNSGSKKPTTARKKHGESKADEARVLSEAGRTRHNAETFMAANEGAARFFDTIFRRQEDREKALHLFAANKWQS